MSGKNARSRVLPTVVVVVLILTLAGCSSNGATSEEGSKIFAPEKTVAGAKATGGEPAAGNMTLMASQLHPPSATTVATTTDHCSHLILTTWERAILSARIS